jgi:hypothetical protein
MNVIDAGADPIGAADSTAAFQTAANAGGRLYMPAGKYKLSASTVLPLPDMEIIGDGTATRLQPITPGQSVFSESLPAGEGGLVFKDFDIDGDAHPDLTGIALTQLDGTRIAGIRFRGVQTTINIDRGAGHIIRDCISTGSIHNMAGQLKLWSSIETPGDPNAYIYNAQIENYLILATESPNLWGAISPAVWVRRAVTLDAKSIVAPHLQFPSPSVFMHFEGDCQGIDLFRCVVNGCSTGFEFLSEGGAAPAYSTISECGADVFSVAGLNMVNGWFNKIVKSYFTDPTGAAVPCINLNGSNVCEVEGNKLINYSAMAGVGIQVQSGGFHRLIGNTAWQLAKAINLSGSPIMDINLNSALRCTSGLVGSMGTGSQSSMNRGF